ncbi:hypothetical protein T492DRAFT_517597 [Pavlovales sp. CCMP2436]|nr:hypothetical protein T492DRAFT_517597 [Pavlovales sp. CCMP2436]
MSDKYTSLRIFPRQPFPTSSKCSSTYHTYNTENPTQLCPQTVRIVTGPAPPPLRLRPLLSAACMSLLSKKMPKSWAAGILNAGFLTTLTGLGGRVLGNLLVSALGSLVAPNSMDNALMLPLYVEWALTMGVFYTCYHRFLSVSV